MSTDDIVTPDYEADVRAAFRRWWPTATEADVKHHAAEWRAWCERERETLVLRAKMGLPSVKPYDWAIDPEELKP